jgi:hypothetical protein
MFISINEIFQQHPEYETAAVDAYIQSSLDKQSQLEQQQQQYYHYKMAANGFVVIKQNIKLTKLNENKIETVLAMLLRQAL